MTTVVNKRTEAYDEYIGRGSPFGNPFSHLKSSFQDTEIVATREEAIARYREWFALQLKLSPDFAAKVEALRGKRLGCYCKPLACHGDVIVEYLERTPQVTPQVQEINCDIFAAPIDAIIHQANCQCTMGSGIAAALRARWPIVYEEDCKTVKGDRNKLGSFSVALISDPTSRIKWVFNMYSQFLYGRDKRYTDYEAVSRGLERIRASLETETSYGIQTIGIPYKMSCNLAGGNWRIVKTIIEETFKDSNFKILICRKE